MLEFSLTKMSFMINRIKSSSLCHLLNSLNPEDFMEKYNLLTKFETWMFIKKYKKTYQTSLIKYTTRFENSAFIKNYVPLNLH